MVTAKFHSTAAVVCMMAIVAGCTTVREVHSGPGPVDLTVSGKPLVPKTGQEILTIARQTKFYSDGKLIRKLATGQTFEYVPAHSDSADPLTKSMTDGVLTHMFTVTGTPPPGGFAPGTYYVWVEFLDGRWQAVTVDSAGVSRCETAGVMVRQEIRRGEEEHSRVPEFAIHPSHGALGGVARLIVWGEYSTNWVPAGPPPACKRTIYCIPQGPT